MYFESEGVVGIGIPRIGCGRILSPATHSRVSSNRSQTTHAAVARVQRTTHFLTAIIIIIIICYYLNSRALFRIQSRQDGQDRTVSGCQPANAQRSGRAHMSPLHRARKTCLKQPPSTPNVRGIDSTRPRRGDCKDDLSLKIAHSPQNRQSRDTEFSPEAEVAHAPPRSKCPSSSCGEPGGVRRYSGARTCLRGSTGGTGGVRSAKHGPVEEVRLGGTEAVPLGPCGV